MMKRVRLLILSWLVVGAMYGAGGSYGVGDRNGAGDRNSVGDSVKVVKPKFLYDVDFLTYFDNREYKKVYQEPQTIFGFRLSPEIGLGIVERNGVSHKLMAGVSYLQPLGGNWKDVKLSATAYYQLRYKGITMNLGAVPYKYFIRQLPDFMRYDSVAYYHPNIQGALMQYESKWGFVEFMCDWWGMQRVDQREMFRLTVDGEFRYTGLFRYMIGGVAQMGHKANKKSPSPREGVADDIYVSPNISIDFAPAIPLDTLCLRASYIYGLQQFRHHEKHQPQGLMLEFMIRWKMLGAKNTFYYGDNLMPLYGLFGCDLNQGDPFYQAKLYNRTDIYVYLYNNSFINCYFSWNMHYIRESGLQHQQQLILLFSLDGLKKAERLRGLFEK